MMSAHFECQPIGKETSKYFDKNVSLMSLWTWLRLSYALKYYCNKSPTYCLMCKKIFLHADNIFWLVIANFSESCAPYVI